MPTRDARGESAYESLEYPTLAWARGPRPGSAMRLLWDFFPGCATTAWWSPFMGTHHQRCSYRHGREHRPVLHVM